MHRLNRTEYANAIRDLLALEVDARALLSADEPDQHGFDNVARRAVGVAGALENLSGRGVDGQPVGSR